MCPRRDSHPLACGVTAQFPAALQEAAALARCGMPPRAPYTPARRRVRGGTAVPVPQGAGREMRGVSARPAASVGCTRFALVLRVDLRCTCHVPRMDLTLTRFDFLWSLRR